MEGETFTAKAPPECDRISVTMQSSAFSEPGV